jgi:hypothetical protein
MGREVLTTSGTYLWSFVIQMFVTVYQIIVATVTTKEMISINFSFICSNIPTVPAYGVYISQMIRYSRACGFYQDFFDIGLLLTRKLLNQGFLLVKLKSSLRKFYGRHYDLINPSDLSVVICDTDVRNGLSNHSGDRKTFQVMTST